MIRLILVFVLQWLCPNPIWESIAFWPGDFLHTNLSNRECALRVCPTYIDHIEAGGSGPISNCEVFLWWHRVSRDQTQHHQFQLIPERMWRLEENGWPMVAPCGPWLPCPWNGNLSCQRWRFNKHGDLVWSKSTKICISAIWNSCMTVALFHFELRKQRRIQPGSGKLRRIDYECWLPITKFESNA